jgi:hypothetical protein
LEKEEADSIYLSMPQQFRMMHEDRDRELLGIYRIAGDDSTALYFIHSYNHDDEACSCALVCDFSNDPRIPEERRRWICLNPNVPSVTFALDLCSEIVHADDEEIQHPHDTGYDMRRGTEKSPNNDEDNPLSVIYL